MGKNKLYILIAVMSSVFLFSTAALCNQCAAEAPDGEEIDVGKEQSEGVLDKETEEEAAAEEDESMEAATEEVAEEAEEEEEAVDESEAEETEEEIEDIAPAISIEIYEGPTPADGICYYRVKATVTGNPAPTVSWSRDDSHGTWGTKKAQVNLYSPDETCTLTATATNSEGTAEDSITLSWGCEEENSPPQVTDIILSGEDIYIRTEYEVTAVTTDPDGDSLTYQWSAEDGTLSSSSTNPTKWETPLNEGYYDLTVTVNDGRGGIDTFIKEIHVERPLLHMPVSEEIHPSDIGYIVYPSGVNTTELIIGDSISNTNVQGFFSFDASPFEGKTILDAKLRLNTYKFYPDPSFKGNIIIIYKDYLPLGAGDYIGPSSLVSPYVFDNNKNPLEISDSRLVEKLQQKVDAGGKLQFAIFYANDASDGDNTIDGRQYSKVSITLTVLHE